MIDWCILLRDVGNREEGEGLSFKTGYLQQIAIHIHFDPELILHANNL